MLRSSHHMRVLIWQNDNASIFLRLSKVWSILHHVSVWWVQNKECNFILSSTFLVLFWWFSSQNSCFYHLRFFFWWSIKLKQMSCRWTQISLPFLSQILIRKVCVTDKIKYLEASQKFIFVLCRIVIRSTFPWKFGLTISKNFPSLQINAQINKLLNCLTSLIKSSSINWSGKATVFAKSICLFSPLISDFVIATNEKSKYNFLIKRLESLVAVIVR